MGIDRPDDGDTPDDVPARRADADTDAAPLLDPIARMAEHTRYRGTVEDVSAAARDAWNEALPILRSAWEKHLEKYPERTRLAPRTQPDGSWVADGDRQLNPEQSAEVDRGCARIREVGKNVIVPGMRAIEAEDPSRQLAGFKHRFKGDDRLKEKIADLLEPPSDLTAGQALSAVPDAVRFTFTYRETGYTQGVLTDVERLKERGFELDKLKNTWTSDQYKGVNSQWQDLESGVRFEVQFHTQASLEAKELSHKAYERLRGTAQDEERDELEAFQSRVNAEVPIPPGVNTIEDYPPERRNG